MRVAVVSPPGLLGPYLRRALEPLGHDVDLFAGIDAAATGIDGEHAAVFVAPVVDRRTAGDALRAVRAASPLRDEFPRAIAVALEADAIGRAHDEGFATAITIPFQVDALLAALERGRRGKPRVLLVDDSEVVRRHTGAMLEEAGYDVVYAHDGDEGFERARAEAPDLVLTDVEMPKRDGFALCRAIKDDPTLARTPVVICSSLGEASDLERGFDAGADDYLVKPVIAEELISRLTAIFAQTMPSVRERVLVVDDSAAVRHLVADCLRRQGFQVETAIDGEDGLEKAAGVAATDRSFDLVLTDYDMPRRNGFELVHALKRDLRTRDVPIVMLTARESRRDQAQMRAAGLTSYLVKPFSVDKCIAIVERVLAEARLRRYKEASRLYISAGGVRAAEDQAKGAMFAARAFEIDATLLFSDLSGFTSMSSKMTAPEVIALMNAYFDEMCPVIVDAGGDIDKFIGDAIMAVFQDDVRFDEPHALRAARAAWNMQRALDRFNARRREDDPEVKPVVMRIGLNCGPLVRGDLGSRYVRRDFTCIGDTVNRAQRHESACPLGGVLLSQLVYDRLHDRVIAKELPGIKLKGIEQPVSGWVLEGFRGS
ncbi:MAG: response regulator [Deltaproteobacteria bacterium]|nr:response regulator [Deltaproteobacteria bacterium]